MAGEPIQLSRQQAATIKAALKLFQETYQDGDSLGAVDDFLEEFDQVAPLDEEGIENLLMLLEE